MGVYLCKNCNILISGKIILRKVTANKIFKKCPYCQKIVIKIIKEK